MNRTIVGVIWDMGGILHPTPFELLAEIEAAHGLAPGSLPRGPFAPGGDPEYDAVRRGELEEPEYYRRFGARLRAAGLAVDLRSIIDWTGRDRPEVVAAMRRLGRRYRQAILTNDASHWLGPGWHATWWLRDAFAAIVDSAEVGVRKPAPAIYRRCAAALGLPPEACLFIDDLPVNVAGASAVGMEGFWFDIADPRGSIRRLLDRLDPPAGPGPWADGEGGTVPGRIAAEAIEEGGRER